MAKAQKGFSILDLTSSMGVEFLEDAMLAKYLVGKRNILIAGPAGCGKTHVSEAAVKLALAEVVGLAPEDIQEGIHWKKLSGSTMTDEVLTGIAREGKDGKSMTFLKPTWHDSVHYLFVDEYNRTHPMVMNTLMELIQFGSINGEKLPNLKAVISAINPATDDGQYHVEDMDQAQVERFHVKMHVNGGVNVDYFVKKFSTLVYQKAYNFARSSNLKKVDTTGMSAEEISVLMAEIDNLAAEYAEVIGKVEGEKVGSRGCEWWKNLGGDQHQVSSRTLDYMLEEYVAGRDMRFVANHPLVPRLLAILKDSPEDKFAKALALFNQTNDRSGLEEIAKDHNFYDLVVRKLAAGELRNRDKSFLRKENQNGKTALGPAGVVLMNLPDELKARLLADNLKDSQAEGGSGKFGVFKFFLSQTDEKSVLSPEYLEQAQEFVKSQIASKSEIGRQFKAMSK